MSPRPLILVDPAPRTKAMIFSEESWTRLTEMAEVIAHFDGRMPDSMVEAALPRVDVIIGQTPLPAERIARAPHLKAYINVKGNWEPVVDYGAARARGIEVLSIAPVMAPAVAEMCVGMAIVLGRNIVANDALFRAGKERYGIAGNGAAMSLFDAPIGLVGYGNLGRALVPLLRPFSSRIKVYDPFLTAGFFAEQRLEGASLEDVLQSSAYLFLLAGATSANEGFLDRTKIATIRKDAAVVLASRAEIVDFGAFVEAADRGDFRAAIDVFPVEPVDADDPARKAGNIVFSSHLAGGMQESYRRICELLMDEIPQLLKGLPPLRLQRAEPHLAAMQRSR